MSLRNAQSNSWGTDDRIGGRVWERRIFFLRFLRRFRWAAIVFARLIFLKDLEKATNALARLSLAEGVLGIGNESAETLE